MPGAKERLREFWIKGKRINPVKYKSALKRQTEKLLKREIRYISSFFPYDVKKFHNQNLLYLQGILLPGSPSGKDKDFSFYNRLVNLVTGLELLSIGTSFHDFKSGGSDIAERAENSGEDNGYTLDLLFGDIFYSRAVIYLLRYQDHEVFDRILEALKNLHESRLELHIKIQEVLKRKTDPASIDAEKNLLVDANRLLHVAFDIGCVISNCRNSDSNMKDYFKIAEKVLIYKTYDELLKYIDTFSEVPYSVTSHDYLDSRKREILIEVKEAVSGPDRKAFADSLHAILGSLHKE